MATHSPRVRSKTATPYGRHRLPNTQIRNCSTSNKIRSKRLQHGYSLFPSAFSIPFMNPSIYNPF